MAGVAEGRERSTPGGIGTVMRRFRAAVTVLSVSTVVIGAFAVAIRLLGATGQLRLIPGLRIPTALTGLALLFEGTALWLLGGSGVTVRWRQSTGRWLSFAAGLLGLYLLVTAIGIEVAPARFAAWFAGAEESASGPIPVPAVGLSILCISAGLLLLDTETRQGVWPSQYFALVPAAFGLQSLATYGFAYGGDPMMRDLWALAPASIPTAVALLLLAAGTLAARPDRGIMGVVTGSDLAGFLARRLLPISILIPILLGWLAVAGQQSNLFGMVTATTLLVLSVIIIFVAVIGFYVATLQRLDAERRRVENALRESEARFRLVFENAWTGIGLVDFEGRILDANPALERFLGMPAAQLRGHSFTDITHPEDVGVDDRLFAELRSGKRRGYHLEKRYIRGDGRVVWGRLTASLVEGAAGAPLYAIGMVQDITAQKREEQQLRFILEGSRILSGSLEYDAVISLLLDHFVPAQADTCVVDILETARGEPRVRRGRAATPEMQEILDRILRSAPPDEPLPGVLEVLETGEAKLFTDISEDLLRSIGRSPEEIELLRAIGARWAIVAPLRARGRVIGVISCTRADPGRPYDESDVITTLSLADRAALAIDNARLYRESLRATRVRDHVLRVVAHDLRNPLNTISLAAGILKERMVPEAATDGKKQIEIIERSVRQSSRLIGDLLDVARIEAGRLSMELAPVDAAALIEEAIDMQRSAAARQRLHLDVELSANLPRILADRDRMLQVFGNLIGNAIQFTPPGGRIQVRADAVPGAVRFSVSDNGPGLSETAAERVFEPFWQAHPGTSVGTGLGLAIVRGIVDAHGGQLEVWSREGEGSTFSFTIPTAPEDAGTLSD